MLRENRSERGRGGRRSRPLILIVVGAARTEVSYLSGLRANLAAISVDIKLQPAPGAPKQVVNAALRLRGPDFDDVWCVFDVDEFDIIDAVALAEKEGVHVVVSNPCFELWLLLLFDDCRAHQPNCSAAMRRLKRHIPRYDKARLVFADFAAGVPDAIKRARALENGDARPHPNPSTGMWRLAEAMMGTDNG